MEDTELLNLLARKGGYNEYRLLTPDKGEDWEPQFLFNDVLWRCITRGSLQGPMLSYKTSRGALNYIKKQLQQQNERLERNSEDEE